MVAFVLSLFIGLCWIRGFSLSLSRGMIFGFITKWNNKQANNNKARIKYLHDLSKGKTETGSIMFFEQTWLKLERLIYFVRVKDTLSKPLFACIYCMASVHGSVVFFSMQAVFGVHWPIYLLPAFILALAGLVEVSVKLFDL